MTFFTASFETVLIRYFLMMVAVVASFALGYPIFAILAFPLFISAFAAISFGTKPNQTNQNNRSEDAKEINMVNTAA